MAAPKDVYLPEVLFQIQRVGKSLRVIAIDPISGVEIIMVAPSTGDLEGIKHIATRKLAYVIAKRKQKASAKKDGA